MAVNVMPNRVSQEIADALEIVHAYPSIRELVHTPLPVELVSFTNQTKERR